MLILRKILVYHFFLRLSIFSLNNKLQTFILFCLPYPSFLFNIYIIILNLLFILKQSLWCISKFISECNLRLLKRNFYIIFVGKVSFQPSPAIYLKLVLLASYFTDFFTWWNRELCLETYVLLPTFAVVYLRYYGIST